MPPCGERSSERGPHRRPVAWRERSVWATVNARSSRSSKEVVWSGEEVVWPDGLSVRPHPRGHGPEVRSSGRSHPQGHGPEVREERPDLKHLQKSGPEEAEAWPEHHNPRVLGVEEAGLRWAYWEEGRGTGVTAS